MSEKVENQELEQQTNEQAEEITEEVVEEVALDENEQKIAELEAKLAEQEDRYLRLRADYDNMVRRNKLDREAAEKFRAQSLLTDLIPVLDNLDRALQVEVTSEEATSLYTGVEMVYRQFIDATAKEGLEVIASEGEPFDPNFHQAVMQEQDSDKESGIVLRELQKGYKLKDRVLRPAMVSVNE
ncbi:nucleotide exchange factor GrpE [Metasolibacillus sp.]|uniref:nucleotide exchange factor GrpE n=1 Tax=Metasolibacillus sp. TaxID=2703680 RepID=UPI0025D46B96|nr:nucleotide exchange factor GrpE [Metasolibacillus sp.]MCT6923294.1 nucleotide exchange factor GrpE [Metasolibacillus sp.]MCT6939401.1 nucleotide exchange factor GrpE [Metasolibacillus sp.]